MEITTDDLIAALKKYPRGTVIIGTNGPVLALQEAHELDDENDYQLSNLCIVSYPEKVLDEHGTVLGLVEKVPSCFTVFWLDGERSVLEGSSIEEAFSGAGYGGGALAAVDFYLTGDDKSYIWDATNRSWVNRSWAKVPQ